MKKTVSDVLNGTIGFLETVREKTREYVEKGKQNEGTFAKLVHETFSESEEWGPIPDRVREYLNKGLHAMNIATKDDLEHLKREWEARKSQSGAAGDQVSE
jgi:hypothetical protein